MRPARIIAGPVRLREIFMSLPSLARPLENAAAVALFRFFAPYAIIK